MSVSCPACRCVVDAVACRVGDEIFCLVCSHTFLAPLVSGESRPLDRSEPGDGAERLDTALHDAEVIEAEVLDEHGDAASPLTPMSGPPPLPPLAGLNIVPPPLPSRGAGSVPAAATRLALKLAEGRRFLKIAEANLDAGRPDRLEIELAGAAFEEALAIEPRSADALAGQEHVAEIDRAIVAALLRRRAVHEECEPSPGSSRVVAESPLAKWGESVFASLAETLDDSSGSDGPRSSSLTPRNAASPPPETGRSKSFWEQVTNFFTKYVCPRCDERGGVESGREIVDRFEQVQTTTQIDHHYASDGYTSLGHTERQVQVLVETVEYDQHYLCEECGYARVERHSQTHQL